MMMDVSDDEFVPEAEQPQKPWRPPKEPKEKARKAAPAKKATTPRSKAAPKKAVTA